MHTAQKTFTTVELREKPAIFGYGQLKSKNTDKYTIDSLHDA